MNKGVVLIAQRNQQIDYIKQAEFSAKRIKEHLNLPVTLITDSLYENSLFDKIIVVEKPKSLNIRNYYDGIHNKSTLDFNNCLRHRAYELSPYDETLLLDTDYIIADSILLNCFNMQHNIMMYGKNSFEFSNWRNLKEFDYISDTSPKFYWATVVFFRKSYESKIFFDLISFIQENWQYYRTVYQISSSLYRNDFSFSIAAHIISGLSGENTIKELPGTLYYITDRDILESIDNNSFLFLIEKKNTGEYFPVRLKNKSVHIMNKFSLERVING